MGVGMGHLSLHTCGHFGAICLETRLQSTGSLVAGATAVPGSPPLTFRARDQLRQPHREQLRQQTSREGSAHRGLESKAGSGGE